jgi:hypothetical protein
VVETINCTYDDTQTMLHRNQYFAMSLPAALGLATQLELSFLSGGIAEQVIAVRRATEEEIEGHWAAYDNFCVEVEAIAD